MKKAILGKSGNSNVSVDLKLLMSTRLLITADSGGGKTWLLKRLIEQAFGQVGIIIIDPEGEFAPLRTQFDFFLVGKGGDTPADIRTADKLARTLLEGRASAVCDIYEMPASQRHLWVQRFLDALIDAPKELRHPYLVIVDEAHMFCPEHGKGDSVAADSMRGLATRGRKRMLAGVFATQRLATLSKDLTGMCLNRLVGPTFETINQKRAADELGIPKPEQAEFFATIKLLEPGYFFALGRAITRELKLMHVGTIETPHGEEARKYELKPPPPTEKVREWLVKLGDIPKQAEEEAKTIDDFKRQVRELKSLLRAQPKASVVTSPTALVVDKAKALAISTLANILREAMKIIVRINAINFDATGLTDDDLAKTFERVKHDIKKLAGDRLAVRARELDVLKRDAQRILEKIEAATRKESITIDVGLAKGLGVESKKGAEIASARHGSPEKEAAAHKPRPIEFEGDGSLTGPQKRILEALAAFAGINVTEPSRGLVAGWLGVKAGTGSFKNYLSALRVAGLIETTGEKVKLTSTGWSAAPSVQDPVTDSAELLNRAANVFGSTTAKILRFVHGHQGDEVSRESIGEYLGVSPTTGSFKNYISELRTAGMIEDGSDKKVKAASWMYI